MCELTSNRIPINTWRIIAKYEYKGHAYLLQVDALHEQRLINKEDQDAS